MLTVDPGFASRRRAKVGVLPCRAGGRLRRGELSTVDRQWSDRIRARSEASE